MFRSVILVAVAVGTISACVPACGWDYWADRVVDYWAGPGSWGEPESVLGPGWNGIYALGVAGWIIIEFTDYLPYDGPGPDLVVARAAERHDTASVYISTDGADWEFIGTAVNDPLGMPTGTDFDFGHDVGLIGFVMVVDDAVPGSEDGYNLDAFGVLNGRVVPEPAFAPFLFALVAPVLARVPRGRKRRYRT